MAECKDCAASMGHGTSDDKGLCRRSRLFLINSNTTNKFVSHGHLITVGGMFCCKRQS